MVRAGLLLVLVLVLALAQLTQATEDQDWWQLNTNLRTHLLEGYDKMVMPHRDHNGTVRVWLDVAIRGLTLDEATQILHLNMWVLLIWHDSRLAWDPKDYGGLRSVHFGEDDLWKPDITVYNNAEISEIDHYGNTHVMLWQGWVIWVPPAQVAVECPMDFTHWPYDSQVCHVYFGSWTTHGWQVELTYENYTRKLGNEFNLKDSHHWRLDGGYLKRHDFYYDCCPEPYITMDIGLLMTRVSPTFVSTVVLPAVVVAVMTLVQFILPVGHSKRLLVGCVTLLLVLLELLYLAITIPPLATSIPIIVRYYGQTFVVVAASVCVSAVLQRLVDVPRLNQPPPLALKKLLTGPLATILCLRSYTDKVGLSGGNMEDGEVLEEIKAASYGHEWLLVAATLDRLAAIIFVACFFITLMAYVAPI